MAQSTGNTLNTTVGSVQIQLPLPTPNLVFLDAKPERFRFIIQNYDSTVTYAFTSSTAGLTVTRNEPGVNANRVTVTGLTAAKTGSNITVNAYKTGRDSSGAIIYGERIAYQNIPTLNTLPELNSRASSLMPRDTAGNIELLSGSVNNTKLIVDTYQQFVSKKNVNKYLNTAFSYFKFPAQTNVVLQDFTIDTAGLAASVFDEFVFAKYALTEDRIVGWAPYGNYNAGNGGIDGRYGATPGARNMPGGPLPTTTTLQLQSFKNDVTSTTLGVADGKALLQPIDNFTFIEAGVNQIEPAGYKITQAVKSSGVDLRFRIQIKHNYTSGTDLTSGDTALANYMKSYYATSSAWFSVIKTSAAGENKQYRGVYTSSFGVGGALQKTITRDETQTLVVDTIVPNSDFAVGDVFKIGAIAKRYLPDTILDLYTGNDSRVNNFARHTILKAGTYWSVTNATLNVDINNQPL